MKITDFKKGDIITQVHRSDGIRCEYFGFKLKFMGIEAGRIYLENLNEGFNNRIENVELESCMDIWRFFVICGDDEDENSIQEDTDMNGQMRIQDIEIRMELDQLRYSTNKKEEKEYEWLWQASNDLQERLGYW